MAETAESANSVNVDVNNAISCGGVVTAGLPTSNGGNSRLDSVVSTSGNGNMNFSSSSSEPQNFLRPPLYPFGQGASFPNRDGYVMNPMTTGTNETLTRAQQTWTPMSNFTAPNPYFSGFFGFPSPMQQINQLQQTVKSIEERLDLDSARNSQTMSHKRTSDVSNSRSHTKIHDISDSETVYSDVSSAEENFSSGSDDEQQEDTVLKQSLRDLKAKSATEPKKKDIGMIPVSKMDKLQKLSQDFEAKDVYGEKVDDNLAKTVNAGFQAPFSQSTCKDLIDKYLTPSNCEWVRVPLINPEVWSSESLQEPYRANDKLLYKNQKLVTKALIPIIKIMNKGLDKNSDSENFDWACDAFQLLVYGHKNMSNIRRQFLKPTVSKQYRRLCNPSTPVTENLFGNDLQKQMKDMNEASKLTQDLAGKKTKRKSSFSHSNTKRARYERDHKKEYHQKHFLDKRAHPSNNNNKKKTHGLGRKQ